jgi:hypothetical protein
MQAFGLRNFLDTYNAWEKIFNPNHKTINIGNMDQKGVDRIAANLDSKMSPENLFCDGEISHSQARTKADYYNAVWEELKDVCIQKGLKVPHVYEF